MAVATTDRKLFLGARMKRLRRELGLTQTRMAEDLGVSPSYLNLLERNQRPVTAQVLLRLAEAYDLDLKTLSSDWVPDFTQAQKNYFAEREEAADEMVAQLAYEPLDFAAAARERLAKRH